MESVGIRELRQEASKLLERVAAGETIAITNRGREVARLVPSVGRPRTREDMIAEGTLIPGRGDLRDILPISRPPGARSTAEILDELREER